jgi:hypothetical protein
MATPLENGLTPKQTAFLAAYGRCARIGRAAETAKINRQTHHTWLRDSAAYREAFERTVETIGSMAEDAAIERGIHGVRRLVLYKGRTVKVDGKPLFEVEYSDQLLLAVLRKFRPEYREKTAAEHSGSFDVSIIERLQAGRRRLLEMQAKETA